MTDEEIRAFASLLLAASGETTEKVLASLFKNLLEHPEQFEAVRRDRSLITRAVAETLRYSPPVHMVLRTSDAPVQFGSVTVPANSTVLCLVGAANRDERRFEEPERFNLFREDLNVEQAFSGAANHLAFGLGRHFCVGSLLAKAEVEVATSLLLEALEDLRLVEPCVEVGLFTRAPASLKVRFTPRARPGTAPLGGGA